MEISLLTDCPAFTDDLAGPIFSHWQPLLLNGILEALIEKLQYHCNYKNLPIAWVTHSSGQVFGTVALRTHDLPGYNHFSRWLGDVFMLPPFRGKGIGTALCRTVVGMGNRNAVLPLCICLPWTNRTGIEVLGGLCCDHAPGVAKMKMS